MFNNILLSFQILSELLPMLTSYHDSLTITHSSLTLRLDDIIGFILLSAKLVECVVSKVLELVSSTKASQTVEELKTLWKSLNEFAMVCYLL